MVTSDLTQVSEIRGRIVSDEAVAMARNPIQFGKGLSLSEFQERYGTEEQCREAIVAWRWPKGFVCPACGCRKQTSVIGLERVQD